MSEFPRTSTALRALLDAHGIRLKRRRHGQHFLTDPQAVDAIVRDAAAGPADRVVEVGTGAGLLTHALCETGCEVVTFEVDPDMLRLARSLREWPLRVTFVEGDVLASKHVLAARFREALAVRPPPPGRLLLVSNLPYGAATPILLGVLSLPRPPDGLFVMLQEEVAVKVLAPPGGGTYGAPSAIVGIKAEGRILRRFGPQVFWPRPRVRSALVHLRPRARVPLAPHEHDSFGRFVTALFAHRRKVLATALRLAVPGLESGPAHALVEAGGLAPRARVEEVAPERLLALWRAVGSRD